MHRTIILSNKLVDTPYTTVPYSVPGSKGFIKQSILKQCVTVELNKDKDKWLRNDLLVNDRHTQPFPLHFTPTQWAAAYPQQIVREKNAQIS